MVQFYPIAEKDEEAKRAEGLAVLYANGKIGTMAQWLETLVSEDIGRLHFFNYRMYYRSLPQNVVARSPMLCVALSLIEVLSCNTREADRYVRLLRERQCALRKSDPEYAQTEYCIAFLEAALPHRSKNRILSSLRVLSSLTTEQKESYLKLSFAANRPSIINGGKDFSRYVKYIPKLKNTFQQLAESYYGAKSAGMVDTAIAEILYQQNKLYEALVLIVSVIPQIEREGYVSTLFAAMRVQMQIMVMSGRGTAAKTMVDGIRDRLLAAGAEYLLPNLNALAAWAAMYDGNYEYINRWLQNEAPKEFEEFCTFDRYQYFVKLRCYLLYGEHLPFVALAVRIEPMLLEYGKCMEQCELCTLQALSYAAAGKTTEAFSYLDKALPLAKKFGYDRLLADEGPRLYFLLRAYVKCHGDDPYVKKILDMTKKTALLYPTYLRERKAQLPALTETEREVLHLMATEHTNAEIAGFLNISVNTVKFHTKNIFAKLGAANRRQAVRIAEEGGIL